MPTFSNVSASAGFKGNLVGNVTGTATNVGNSLTVDNSTIQLNSGTTYDGAAARTISLKDGGTTLAKQPIWPQIEYKVEQMVQEQVYLKH